MTRHNEDRTLRVLHEHVSTARSFHIRSMALLHAAGLPLLAKIQSFFA